jgi:hypothetical protein
VRVGVIAEGIKDVPVFEELLPKINPAIVRVVVRPTKGKPRFLQAFPGLLWSFQHVEPHGPVDKAFVIRDANGDDPSEVEATLRLRIQGRVYPFPRGIEFFATKRETETWLLADVEAINQVALRKNGRIVNAIPGPLENIPDAKEQFASLLAQAKLPHVPEIVKAITRLIDLPTLRLHCPSFRRFEQMVL